MTAHLPPLNPDGSGGHADVPDAPVGAPQQQPLTLKALLNRPEEHLQRYPALLEAILNATTMHEETNAYGETVEGNPDADFLKEAIEAIKGLQGVAQLRSFQGAMGRGPTVGDLRFNFSQDFSLFL